MTGRGSITPFVLSEEKAKELWDTSLHGFSAPPDMPTKHSGAGATILIIEDEAPIRALLREVLEHAGYRVVEAPDGRIGLELYRKAPTDLVITDIAMPDRNGLQATRELARELFPAKVIAMSGAPGKQYLCDVAKLLGASRTLQKPFHREELLEAVRLELLR